MNEQKFSDKILAGLSIGIVVALIPGALLGELMKALSGHLAISGTILLITKMATSMLPLAIGVCVGMLFKFTPIQTTSIAIACAVGSGVIRVKDGLLTLAGTGDVINTAITAAIAAFIVIKLGNSLKAYTILLIPLIVIVIAGGIGMFTLPYISKATGILGNIINHITTLQPYIMGILIAIIFALLIVSPFSTVGVAVAIQIGGIASGAANLGIVAAGIGLAISGWKVNSFGTSIAHFLGSPKMQMANFVKKPIMLLPVIANAGVLGLCAAIFDIKGTTMSAGFGLSGLIGPLNAINTGTSVVVAGLVFIVFPVILGFVFDIVFTKIIPLVKPEDYQITYQ